MKKVISSLGAFSLPFIALAQTSATADTVITRISQIFVLVTPVLITLAVLWFFWGLISYLMGDVAEKEKGRTTMIYGVITIFVMVAVFGLVQLIGNTFGIQPGSGINIPQVPR